VAFSLVNSVSVTGGGSTSSAVDTTGADLLVAVLSYFSSSSKTLTDSKGNTWTQLTRRNQGSYSTQIIYSVNPTVGTGHTFTNPGGSFPALMVAAFSDSNTTAPFDVENGASKTSGTTLQTGSVTPSENNELLIAGIVHDKTGITIDSGFTELFDIAYSAGNYMAGGFGYKIQTTAGAENPTFTVASSGTAAAAIATFKSSDPGGGDSVSPLESTPRNRLRRVLTW